MDNNIEKLKSIIDMYKKEQISEYVFERELGTFMGDKVHVDVSRDRKHNQSKSFCIFVMPQLLSDGFHITYVIDNNAVRDIFSSEEFAVIVSRMKRDEQKFLSKYNEFHNEFKDDELCFAKVLGFFLDMYASYMGNFRIPGKVEYMLDLVELKKYADKFNLEDGDKEDLEALIIGGYICEEIKEYAKKYVHTAKEDSLSFKVIDYSAPEKPEFNLGQQEIRKLCTSTFGTRESKEIPYDYQPQR